MGVWFMAVQRQTQFEFHDGVKTNSVCLYAAEKQATKRGEAGGEKGWPFRLRKGLPENWDRSKPNA